MDLTKVNNEGAARLREKLEKKEEEEETPEQEEEQETPAEEPEEVIEEVEEKQEDSMSERERALLKEITRLKADRRESAVKIDLGEITPTVTEPEEEEKAEVTPAEARLFTAWRQEALEELIEKHPQYKTDPKLWERFTQEYSERLPELVWAKRNKVSVNKSLFKERLERVHKSISDGTDSAREEGKKELLKAQSAASVMGAAAVKGTQSSSKKPAQKKRILPRKVGGFESWITKK